MTGELRLKEGKDTPFHPENGQGSDQHWQEPQRDHRDHEKSTLIAGLIRGSLDHCFSSIFTRSDFPSEGDLL